MVDGKQVGEQSWWCGGSERYGPCMPSPKAKQGNAHKGRTTIGTANQPEKEPEPANRGLDTSRRLHALHDAFRLQRHKDEIPLARTSQREERERERERERGGGQQVVLVHTQILVVSVHNN